MCLGVPGRVVAVRRADRDRRLLGRSPRDVCLDVVDEPVAPGDYILNHVGFAIRQDSRAETSRRRSRCTSCCCVRAPRTT